jgi:alkaline phosphatase D
MKPLNSLPFRVWVITLLLSTIGFTISCQNSAEVAEDSQYVVILSLDAFRWDYPTLANTPNINQMAQNGVKAEALIPCYPSKTFPNHYSLATGLHPNNHGLVGNSFLDPELGFYTMGDRNAVENPNFYGGEPFWVTAEKQGLKAATYYWVGSEAPIGGDYPSFWKKYNQKVSFDDRIDTVISWLSLPLEQRPNLIAWYYHEPDLIAHHDGPTGTKTLAKVEQLDSLVGVFINRLNELPIADKINLILVSDHGMADISPEKYINLNKYVERDWFDVITGGSPVYSLQPKDEYREQAIATLKAIPNLKVWERHDIPERLHYGSNPRIQDILIEANEHYSVGFSTDSSRYTGGAHGYDNANPDMHGIFFAQGPAFKKGYQHKTFINTNVYNIVINALGLTPAENDGNWEDVKDIFK